MNKNIHPVISNVIYIIHTKSYIIIFINPNIHFDINHSKIIIKTLQHNDCSQNVSFIIYNIKIIIMINFLFFIVVTR